MEANELRIGNYVKPYAFNEGLAYEVVEIVSTHITIMINREEFCNGYDKFEPIKLTEDWLLKFGAIKSLIYHFRLNEKQSLNINIKNISNEIYVEIETYTDDGFNLSESIDLIIDLRYVHQLQNLYFALTQKELKI